MSYKTKRFGLTTPEPGEPPAATGQLKTLAEQLDALIYQTGDLRFTARPALGAGWMACEGQEVSRAVYADLFEAIGTAYGEGNKSTTFNVPDYRGRVPMGAGKGTGGEESETFPSRTRGQKIGALVHKLTIGQLPSHKHGVTDPGHSHYIAPYNDGSGGNPAFSWTAGMNGNPHTPAGTGPEKTGVSTNNEGAGETHNIVQPSTVCNVWIKT